MTRLEILQARMRAEQARKAAPKSMKTPRVVKSVPVKPVPVKPKVAVRFLKPVAPERTAWVESKPTLREAIAQLTPDEASSEKNVATVVALHVIEQIMRSPRQFDMMNVNMSRSLAYLTAAPYADKINLKRILSTALLLCDSAECRSQSEEGSGIRALHEVERVLLQLKARAS